MAEEDALSKFDFSKVMSDGIYLKFEPGVPVSVRVLTTDPIVFSTEFQDRKTGELVVGTRFAFLVYNLVADCAQIMQATPKLAKDLSELHLDEEFGANVKKVDVRITPPDKGVIAAYDLKVLRHSGNERQLTPEQIEKARAINLDEIMADKHGGRMSIWKPKQQKNDGDGYAKARAVADSLGSRSSSDDIEDEPINLDDIPF